jgi:hypothetical protein
MRLKRGHFRTPRRELPSGQEKPMTLQSDGNPKVPENQRITLVCAGRTSNVFFTYFL